MSVSTVTPLFRRIWEPLAAAPPVLLAYAAFASMVTLADFSMLVLRWETARTWLVPYTGWMPSMPYAFTIFFAFALIYQSRRRWTLRLTIIVQFVLQIAFNAYVLAHASVKAFGNPYLTMNPWRLIWTIGVPCLWIVMLYSPRMNGFCEDRVKGSASCG